MNAVVMTAKVGVPDAMYYPAGESVVPLGTIHFEDDSPSRVAEMGLGVGPLSTRVGRHLAIKTKMIHVRK